MAYRNGTYIAFHAGGTADPTASDIRYYRMLKAWHEHDHIEFEFINSHDKVAGVRDSSTKATLRRSLVERLNKSKNMVLIIGQTTRFDTDWVPFEIGYAVDVCKIPIIATYTGYDWIVGSPELLRDLWPPAFATRIDKGTVRAIHIPFKQRAIDDAIGQFSHEKLPATPLNYYKADAHRTFGIALPAGLSAPRPRISCRVGVSPTARPPRGEMAVVGLWLTTTMGSSPKLPPVICATVDGRGGLPLVTRRRDSLQSPG